MAEAPLERKEPGKDLRQLVLLKTEMKPIKQSSVFSNSKTDWKTVYSIVCRKLEGLGSNLFSFKEMVI